MQQNTASFNNTILSGHFVVHVIVWPIFFATLLDFLYEMPMGVYVQFTASSFSNYALYHWGRYLLYFYLITILFLCTEKIPSYLNKYSVQNGQLHIKEYMYFLPILDVSVPLQYITKTEIRNSKSLFRKRKLVIYVGDKAYNLHTTNQTSELHQYLQTQIGND